MKSNNNKIQSEKSKNENNKTLSNKRKRSKSLKNNLENICKLNKNPKSIKKNQLLINNDKLDYIITFIVVNSNEYLYLIYTNNKNSIIFYNLLDNKKVSEIKNAHISKINDLKHIYDTINERDLILSISHEIDIKIWDINKLECLSNFYNKINKDKFKYIFISYDWSACFLNDNNQIYVLSDLNSKQIEVFDLNGNIKKKIDNSSDGAKIIESYYDNKLSKNFIIVSFWAKVIRVYDYNQNKIYQTYLNIICSNFNIFEKNKNVYLIASDYFKKYDIKIWDFHSGKLLKIICVGTGEIFKTGNKDVFLYTPNYQIISLCKWNNDYIFVGYNYFNNQRNIIKLLEIETGRILNELYFYRKKIQKIVKVVHPKYSACLLILDDNGLMLWT